MKSEDNLTQASNAFSAAQNEVYQAALATKERLTENLDAYLTFNLTFQTYQMAKKIIQKQLDRKTMSDVVVQMASNQASLARTVNDNALKKLNEAQDKYRKSNSVFNSVLKEAVGLGYSFEAARDQLGVAKFSLRQAKDKLLVAQAAKKEADKATAIIAMTSAALPKDPSAFKGCDQGAYPTMVGTIQI